MTSDALRLVSAKTEALDASARADIVGVCIAAHDNADFANLFTKYVPSGGWHFLGYCDDALVVHAMVTTRWLQPEGLPELRTAYVDAVSTAPSAQRRGFASALMRRLALDAATEYTIAALETESPAFYEPLGWQRWRGALAGRGADGLVPTPEQHNVMVLRFAHTPPLDLHRSMTIECQPFRIW